MERRDFLILASSSLFLPSCSESEKNLGKVEEILKSNVQFFEFNGRTIFLKWVHKNPILMDLTCTHKKCTVKMKKSENQFVCPCHKGKYDLDGNVLSGKPTKPLRKFHAKIIEGNLWIFNEYL